MASGLAALLDDIAMIAKVAAASLDDVGAAAGKASAKAAGVVIDDTAVTPRYVTGFTPDRELPVIYRIARGSLRNKLLFILPIALLLSYFLPWVITPILMAGGSYLCFEGIEKLLEALRPSATSTEDALAELSSAEHEAKMVSGAIRTDFILSAEIMAIALAEVSDKSIVQQGLILAVVGVAITIAVYGAVGLIVKMDDIGLHLVKKPSSAAKLVGSALLKAMPVLLALLATVGTLAMLWVGGGIILHGSEVLGFAAPAHLAHAAQHAVEQSTGALGGVLGWLTYAVSSALVGLVLGAIVAMLVHVIAKARAH